MSGRLADAHTDGKVESDQQYRGFRWWNNGGGSRTGNNHFTRDVLRADGTRAYVGYGVNRRVAASVSAGFELPKVGEHRQPLQFHDRAPREIRR